MKRFFFYCRLYVMLVSQYVKTRMQYRFDFVMSTIGMLFYQGAGIASLWILMSNMPLLSGWKFAELMFIYSFSLLAQTPLQICFEHIWHLRVHVNQGTFIKYYFKPINSLFYYLSEMVDLKGFGQIILAASVFVWSSHELAIAWTPSRIVLFPLLLVGSSAVIASLMLMAASTAFWVKDSYSIVAFINSFREQSKYPMNIYNALFKFLFTWVLPIGFFAFYPAQLYLRPMPLSWIVFVSPLVGVALFILAVRMWEKGITVWGGTGS